MKTLKTNHKFYKKWLYKVSLEMPGGNIFRYYPVEEIKDKLMLTENNPLPYGVYGAVGNKVNLIALAEFLKSKDSSAWTKRIERNFLDIYTNDSNLYNEISETFKLLVFHRFEPTNDVENLLTDPKTIACDKLPHNKYNYRVYLKPHILKGDVEAKEKYINWIQSQGSKITCTPAVKKWFMKTDWNWDRRYVLVEDDHTLLMLKLRNSEVMGTVYNYVVIDKY